MTSVVLVFPHHDIATSMSSPLARVTSGAGPLLTSLVMSVFKSALVVMLDCAPDADDPPHETGVSGGKFYCVFSAIFF